MQQLLFSAMDYHLTLTENLVVASVFTSASLLRSYILRRLFNLLRDHLP